MLLNIHNCVVAAYACPETEKRKYKKIIRNLKNRQDVNPVEEVKLHQVSESNYLIFLDELNSLEGILLSVATDSHNNLEELVKDHQRNQAQSMLNNIDEMKYESGKSAVRYLATQLEGLSPQLYVQLCCQIQLMLSFVNRGIAYFVQRKPNALKNFRWRIDQKEPQKKTAFEDAFEKFCPALLQTLSLQEPCPALSWCDYRPMYEYMYKKGEIPDYLVEKFPHLKNEEGFDIQKIIRKDVNFIDSNSYEGIQVVDLLASGLRKLLRQEFEDNYKVAENLGRLMVQEKKNQPPIKLITFGAEKNADDEFADIVRVFSKFCCPMMRRS